MTEARASHLRLVVSQPAPVTARTPKLRFKPVVRLTDGEAFGMHAETDINFEDTFQPRHLSDAAHPCAASWMGDLIERVGRLAHDGNNKLRPISISAPMALLASADGPMAVEAGVKRTNLLPQEVRIDFCDASIVALEDLALDKLEAFRRRGFRVGLDARKTWRTPMGARARALFEAVRLDPSRFDMLDVPLSRLEIASSEGCALIAEGAHWRDATKLAEVGIHFAMAPRSDS